MINKDYILQPTLSTCLGLTLIITNILISQVLSELIVNIASKLVIVETSVIYHGLKLELVPSRFICLCYSFIVPDLVFILDGQATLDNMENQLNFRFYKPIKNCWPSKLNSKEKAGEASPVYQKNMAFLEILEKEHLHQNISRTGKRKNEVFRY